jgi:serine/threonine-protein kinase
MGIVYLAEHIQLAKKVALKILAPELADDLTFRERFIRECRVAAALDHPNIVSVDYAGESDGQLYIAMRLVKGRDLSQLLAAEAPLDPWRAVLLLEQAASALDTAHEASLVHRDVKPGNILIAPQPSSSSSIGERVFLTDFGLTKRMDSKTALTRTGYFMGTLNYAAPEQIKGETIDGRCDEYSLGCVAFECLTGVIPFEADSDAGVLGAHLFGPIPLASSKRMELPEGVDEVIARALAKDPKDRYDTCLDFVADLRTHTGAPTAPPPVSPPVGIPSTVMAAPPISEATTPLPGPAAPATPAAAAATEMIPPTPSPAEVVSSAPPTPRPPVVVPTAGRGGKGRVFATILLLLLLIAGGTVFALTRNSEQGTSAGPSSVIQATGPSPTSSTIPSTTPSTSCTADAVLPDGRWFGRIEAIDLATNTLQFDLACFWEGDTANQKADAAGFATPVSFFVENDNPEIRPLTLAPDVEIRLADLSDCCDLDCCEPTILGDLTLFAQNIGRHLHPQPPYNGKMSYYWVTVQNGLVVLIEEQVPPKPGEGPGN